jgi:hypothetical protein
MESKRKIILGGRFKHAGSTGKKAHVISRKGHWVIFREGGERVLGEYNSKINAMREVRKLKDSGISDKIVLHRKDGTVEKVH